MANRVKVTSVEAIESFRAALIIYISKARPSLEEIHAEVSRLRMWIQVDRRGYWENVYKKRRRAWDEAKAAVFSSRLSNLQETSAAQLMAVTRAKQALDEAEGKLRAIKRWDRDFDNQIEPIARQLEKLQSFLTDDLGRAVIYLHQTLKSLNAYTEMVAPSLDAPENAPSSNAGEETALPGNPDVSPAPKGGQT